MNGLVFAQPVWFWGLAALLPLLALRLRTHWKASRQLPGLISPRLASRLVSGNNEARRWLVFALRGFALVCLLAALARPQLGFEEIESESDARNLLIAVDTSRSMLADDVPPSRLARTKLAAKDIALSLPDDRIGVIAFAGSAFLQAPLTIDHEAVLETIDQLDTDTIPRGGTNLSACVALALETVREAKAGPSALVLFSDGEAHEGLDRIESIRAEAAKAGLVILTVGVGTAAGSIIPETDENGRPVPGVFVKDENNQVVRTRLVDHGLRALAAGGGAYATLGGAEPLPRVVEQIRANLASSREKSEALRRPIERFLWPLGAATILMALSHLVPLFLLKPRAAGNPALRRRAAATGMFLIFAAPALEAADPLSTGHAAFEQQDYAGALSAYEGRLGETRGARDRSRLQMGIGAAAYRLGDFERAAEAFGSAAAEGDSRQRGEALYNLGNTLFRKGESALAPPTAPDPDQPRPLGPQGGAEAVMQVWQGAIEHYETSLALDPENARTRHNLDHVKARLEELKQQQEQQQQQQKDSQEKEEEKKEEKDEKEEEKQDQKDQQQQEENEEPRDPGQGENSPEPRDPGEPPPPQDSKEPSPDTPPEPGEKPPGDPGEQNPPEEPSSPDSPDPSDSPEPGQAPPPQPDAPAEGKLEANPNQPGQTPPPAPRAGEMRPEDRLANPETGYAPTEARQLLDALADETEVRPLPPAPPSRGERFKNW